MATNNDINGLHDIHHLLVDSRKGYLEAKTRVEDVPTKDLLASFAGERVGLEDEVHALLQQLEPGETLREGGTIKGDLHRTWMDLRDSLTKSENANVLSECERGEEYLITRYDEVLKQVDLGDGTRTLAYSQRGKVQMNLGRIKELRRSFEAIEK